MIERDRAPERNARRFGGMTVGEWLTALTGIGTLIVAILAYQLARDTSDMRAALKHLSDLADQTKRQADNSDSEVGLLTQQLIAAQTQAGSAVKLANAGEASAKTAGAQLAEVQKEERPWISISTASIGSPLTIDDNFGPEISINLRIAVHGAHPAFRVGGIARFIQKGPNALKIQDTLCASGRTPLFKGMSYVERTLFPGQVTDVFAFTDNGPGEVQFWRKAGVTKIPAAIVGCVVYAEANGTQHYTGFLYDLFLKTGPTIHDIAAIDLNRNTTPEADLMIAGDILGTGRAK